jgi:hypothetical protein
MGNSERKRQVAEKLLSSSEVLSCSGRDGRSDIAMCRPIEKVILSKMILVALIQETAYKLTWTFFFGK